MFNISHETSEGFVTNHARPNKRWPPGQDVHKTCHRRPMRDQRPRKTMPDASFGGCTCSRCPAFASTPGGRDRTSNVLNQYRPFFPNLKIPNVDNHAPKKLLKEPSVLAGLVFRTSPHCKQSCPSIRWASARLPPDFRQTSAGRPPSFGHAQSDHSTDLVFENREDICVKPRR